MRRKYITINENVSIYFFHGIYVYIDIFFITDPNRGKNKRDESVRKQRKNCTETLVQLEEIVLVDKLIIE